MSVCLWCNVFCWHNKGNSNNNNIMTIIVTTTTTTTTVFLLSPSLPLRESEALLGRPESGQCWSDERWPEREKIDASVGSDHSLAHHQWRAGQSAIKRKWWSMLERSLDERDNCVPSLSLSLSLSAAPIDSCVTVGEWVTGEKKEWQRMDEESSQRLELPQWHRSVGFKWL